MSYSYDRTANRDLKASMRTAKTGESFEDFYENISSKASNKLRELDESFVRTPDYMGVAYFWNPAYKFSLRDASSEKRRAVHAAMLKAGLEVDGSTPAHDEIVKKLVGL